MQDLERKKKEKEANDFMDVIEAQNIDGSWNEQDSGLRQKLAEVGLFEISELEGISKKQLTKLIVERITQKHPEKVQKLKLILAKANNWVAKN